MTINTSNEETTTFSEKREEKTGVEKSLTGFNRVTEAPEHLRWTGCITGVVCH